MTCLHVMTSLEWMPSYPLFYYLKPDSFIGVWEQVRDGGYVGCDITISIDPVKFEGFGRVWDVIPGP